jgi:hypothetical protein
LFHIKVSFECTIPTSVVICAAAGTVNAGDDQVVVIITLYEADAANGLLTSSEVLLHDIKQTNDITRKYFIKELDS